MYGRIVLITGASSGIGLQLAMGLARLGAHLVLVCRDLERGTAAQRLVAEVATGKPPRLLLADLSSQRSIRALARELHDSLPRLDVLINNAGGVSSRRELTEDGIERTFATNHLAPFLLTSLLYPVLRVSPSARIINVTSDVYPAELDFENLQGERRYRFLKLYFQSKLENILFTFELDRRLRGTSVTANCFSPGPTLTRLGDNLTGLPRLFPLIMKRLPFLFRPAEQGASTGVYAATAPELSEVSGAYFFRMQQRRTKPITRDPAVAARLWQVSTDLTALSSATSIPEKAAADDTPLTRLRAVRPEVLS